MKKELLLCLLLLIPSTLCLAYRDHRGHDLDSLERTIAHWTTETLHQAGEEAQAAYCKTCRELAWGYLQLDGPRSMYYAKRAIEIGRLNSDHDSIYDASILVGQIFWAKEQFDSARVYYGMASAALDTIREEWDSPNTHDLEAQQSRLWGTLGNFYAAQDSVEQFTHYYDKAGEIFEKWGWWEDCSILHYNLGETYADYDDLKRAKSEYDLALQFAMQSGDSLIIAKALYGQGHWYELSGRMGKALEYLTKADEYFGNHALEEAYAHAQTLEIMRGAYSQLYRNARIIAAGAILLILLTGVSILVVFRLKRTRKELAETTAVLDETIEELRPDTGDDTIPDITPQEAAIAGLLAQGRSTKEIAEQVHLGTNTVLWYRKRLYVKFDVHSAAAFATEWAKRGGEGRVSPK